MSVSRFELTKERRREPAATTSVFFDLDEDVHMFDEFPSGSRCARVLGESGRGAGHLVLVCSVSTVIMMEAGGHTGILATRRRD